MLTILLTITIAQKFPSQYTNGSPQKQPTGFCESIAAKNNGSPCVSPGGSATTKLTSSKEESKEIRSPIILKPGSPAISVLKTLDLSPQVQQKEMQVFPEFFGCEQHRRKDILTLFIEKN